MNEQQLKQHIEKFAGRGLYLLEVECPTTYVSINLSDRHLAFMLCDTAAKSGITKYIRLYHHPDANTEHVLFDSDSAQDERLAGKPA